MTNPNSALIIVQPSKRWPFDFKVIRTSQSGIPVASFSSNHEEAVLARAREWAEIYKLPD